MTIADPLEQRVVDIVQDTIRTVNGDAALSIEPSASMDTVPGWDSLTFMTVFSAVNDAFDIDPDFDDAIHYTSVPSMVAYLRQTTS
jgi:acyl carrier protein